MGGGGGGGDEMGLPNGDESFMNCSSSGMSTNPFFAPGWDPAVSLSQHENFGTSSIVSQSEFTNSLYPGVMANQGISSSSHHDHYTSDSTFVELVPKFPCFGSGNFSDMIGSFGLTECGQIANTGCPPSYILTKEGKNERNMAIDTQSQEDQRLMHEASLGASPTGKRRKRTTESNTHFDPTKDPYKENSDKAKKQDDKKPRTEQAAGSNVQDEEATKQSKDNSNSGGAPKENYIHVRARRGQATNSHSLAERVRREKISERMRLLQDLVPGCNKITGKAVMLDEIINYVQSLQQQVEFLSMKLATVNPELNVDLERLLSKDILHPRVGNPSIMGLSSGMSSYPFSLGIFQPSTLVLPNVNPQLPSVPQAVLDNELQSLMQMGFESNSAIDSLGPNGPLKLEL